MDAHQRSTDALVDRREVRRYPKDGPGHQSDEVQRGLAHLGLVLLLPLLEPVPVVVAGERTKETEQARAERIGWVVA